MQSQLASALSSDEVQSYLEQWVKMRYAFHWGHGLAPPLLIAHRNHQQDALLLRWEGLVAGIDGSVDEHTSTECMGAGYAVGDNVAPLMTLSLLVDGPQSSFRAEAASLLQLFRDMAGKYGRCIRLLIFINCLLLDILR